MPNSVRYMARVEAELETTSTWYFRWRTARRPIIDDLRGSGHSIGFHFETLSRAARQAEVARDELDSRETIRRFRSELLREIDAFEAAFGPVSTIAAHGDTRVREASNRHLSRRLGPEKLNGRFDADEALRHAEVALKITDRVGAGHWSKGSDPHRAIASHLSPIFCLTHPNNWASGAARGFDRFVRTPFRTGAARIRHRDSTVTVDSPRPSVS